MSEQEIVAVNANFNHDERPTFISISFMQGVVAEGVVASGSISIHLAPAGNKALMVNDGTLKIGSNTILYPTILMLKSGSLECSNHTAAQSMRVFAGKDASIIGCDLSNLHSYSDADFCSWGATYPQIQTYCDAEAAQTIL